MSSGLTVALALLTNAMVAEITTTNGIDWKSAPHKESFWILGCTIVVWIMSQTFYYREDLSIREFKDDDFCLAYVRRTHLTAHAKSVLAGGVSNLQDVEVILSKLKIKKGGKK